MAVEFDRADCVASYCRVSSACLTLGFISHAIPQVFSLSTRQYTTHRRYRFLSRTGRGRMFHIYISSIMELDKTGGHIHNNCTFSI